MRLQIFLLLVLVGHAFVRCQDFALEGRFLPLDGNPTGLPAAVSWPSSQINASFIGSSSVTAVIKDLTYTSASDIGLLPRGVSLLVNGAGVPTTTNVGDTISFTLANLPLTAAVVSVTKEDECATGA